jgi:hypothetical protein
MALIDFLHSLPLWLLAIVLNVWLIGTALAGMWLMRRHVIPWLQLRGDDSIKSPQHVQSAMLLYSLIAALTAVGVWTKYSEASSVVSAEATAITTLWRDLGGYPDPLSDAMQDVLRDYTDQVINGAWPQLRRGEIPSEGVEWMDRLQALLYNFEPVTEGQKVLHGETLSAFNALVHQRRQRLDAALSGLPGVMWLVLLTGAMGGVVLWLFCYVDNLRLQVILMLGVAGSLAMVLFVIFALDRPFRGDMGIRPDSYQLIYDQHMTGQ